MTTAAPHRFVVTSSPGLEGLLREELHGLGIKITADAPGTVSFDGTFDEAARVLVRSRLASRVLLTLRGFAAKNAAMLYDQVRRIDWPAAFGDCRSFAIRAYGVTESEDLKLSFVSLKIKDAICDEFRKRGYERPDVDRADPELRLEAFFRGGRCELSVDLAGLPLHRRGYRLEGGEAPLRESRAAGLLRFAGYDGTQKLIDPFCGSGTIAIEAALMLAQRAPALGRPVEDFAWYKILPAQRPVLEAALRTARAEAPAVASLEAKHILACDLSEKVLNSARENAKRAGVAALIDFRRADARELGVRESLIVTNPPYGERLEAAAATEILSAFTRQLKHYCSPCTLAVVLPRGPLEKAVGLKPAKKMDLDNGPIASRYLKFELFEGKRRPT